MKTMMTLITTLVYGKVLEMKRDRKIKLHNSFYIIYDWFIALSKHQEIKLLHLKQNITSNKYVVYDTLGKVCGR